MEFINRIEKKVAFGPVRIVWPHLDKPHAIKGSDANAKYSTTLLIPKDDAELMKELKLAFGIALSEKFGNKVPANLTSPFKDGDTKEQDFLHSHFFMDAKSNNPVGVLDAARQRMEPEAVAKIKGGDWVLAVVSFFGYDSAGNKGISAGLESLMYLKPDTEIGGGDSSAMMADFDATKFLGAGLPGMPGADSFRRGGDAADADPFGTTPGPDPFGTTQPVTGGLDPFS